MPFVFLDGVEAWCRGGGHDQSKNDLCPPHWPKLVQAKMWLILTLSHMVLVIVVEDSDLNYTYLR